jgi:cyclophilin family peptidyl-prolyl cis-trans isomerase
MARSDRRRTGKTKSDQIEFPGIMGFMQRNMRVIVLVGLVVLLASIGTPIFTSILSSNGPSNDSQELAATATASVEATTAAVNDAVAIRRKYDVQPEFILLEGAQYEAIIELEKGGEIRIALFADESPNYVNNFVFLSRNSFFDGLTFHRVIAGFVAQGGDPSGTGLSGSGYYLDEEANDIYLDRAGLISMAKSPAGVSGSQFFITLAPTPWLTGDFTVFGEIIEGMDVVQSITVREPGPTQPAAEIIKTIKIIEK